MAFCELCKTEGQKTGTCAYCGTVKIYSSVTFIYGQTEKDSYNSEIKLTNKYLIVRSVSQAETAGNAVAGAAFGLIGALTATAIDSARKKSYGFYDLQDLQKVIYPYHTNSIKKDTALKFINKDGSDFILNFNLNGMFGVKLANRFADLLVQGGVFVENGADSEYPFCCMNPFVNRYTFGKRVCQSAAAFVKMTDDQFVAPPISEGFQINQAQSAPQGFNRPVQQTSVQQPIYQAPMQHTPVVEISQAPTENATRQASVTPTGEEKTEYKKCSNCGSTNLNIARFCCNCGTAFASNQQTAFSVDDWKNKW